MRQDSCVRKWAGSPLRLAIATLIRFWYVLITVGPNVMIVMAIGVFSLVTATRLSRQCFKPRQVE
ncbi:hypothetical protein KCP69_10715 [Salmonella enterica subsp. enterica]|nr:hypothetical protein KCP69_10715 [Salmonella enterica subsp. enterica]